MRDAPWQVRISERSIKKRDKLRLLDRWLAGPPPRLALEVGCAQGILGWHLRKKGGFWAGADQDMANLRTARELLGTGLVRMPEGRLPFRTEAFDLVTCLDYLEHIDNDAECLRECFRVLRPGGELVVVTPHTGRLFIVHRLRDALGMKLEFYGHKREGYSSRALSALLESAGFEVVRTKTYSKTFSELIELLLNVAYIRLAARGPSRRALRDGHIRPSTAEEYEAQSGKLKAYGAVYPIVWLVSRLDVFLFFLKGYSVMVKARRPA